MSHDTDIYWTPFDIDNIPTMLVDFDVSKILENQEKQHFIVSFDVFDKKINVDTLCMLFGIMGFNCTNTFTIRTKEHIRATEFIDSILNRNFVGGIIFINLLRQESPNINPETYRYDKDRPWPLPNVTIEFI